MKLPVAIPLLFVAAWAVGCSRERPVDVAPAAQSIRSEDLLRHIEVLASDEFEGRAPATRGEELTVEYLTDQFRQLGLEPGNPDGSYVQNVPMVGIRSQASGSINVNGKLLRLRPKADYVAITRHPQPQVSVKDSDVVFVGYGVQAPEYDWDDYKGMDLKGKTLVMLVNDPPIPDPNDPSQLDPDMFKGQAMTYYGRWTYKYEIASEMGAAAAVIVHETVPAGYPFEVLSGNWGREDFDIQRPGGNGGRLPVEAWITVEKARELFHLAGKDYGQMKQAAIQRDFQPVPLNAKANFLLRNSSREVQSRNVVAKVTGSDPQLREEYVIYTAHWDHLGKDETLEGDQIFNGALDNASGTAALLELAKAYKQLPEPPRRSVLFIALTAEEKGLLGARYYAQNPLYPLAKTAANINMDGINPWGRTRDLVVVGLGNSTLDDVTESVAKEQGRIVKPDAEPEKGFYYRSDHFELAKVGVPALYTGSGTEYIGRPAEYGKEKRRQYTANDYHKVSDEVKPDWDLAGGVEDIQLLFHVGYRVAQESTLPEWKPGAEFKAIREQTLAAAR